MADHLLLRNGELLPADAELISAEASFDYSFVTGEADLQTFSKGNALYAGGRLSGPMAEVKLKKRVSAGYLDRLWNQQEKKPEATLMNSTGKWFTLAVLSLSFGTGLYWYFNAPEKVWETVTAVLIIACPCALALAAPFTYGNGLRILGRNGFYLRAAEGIEQLSKLQHLVFDKTGTITHKGSSKLKNNSSATPAQLTAIAAVCRSSSHPLSQQIWQYLKPQLDVQQLPTVTHYEELAGKGLLAEVEGHKLTVGSAAFVEAAPAAQVGTQVHIRYNNHYLGYFGFSSQFRQGLFAVLEELSSRFTLHLLSGDSERDKPALAASFSHLQFGCKPQQKQQVISALEAQAPTAMLGDGLNDAGALQAASMGISVSDDVHQFLPACNAILQAEKLPLLPHMLRFARRSQKLVVAAIALSLLYNLVGLSFAVAGLLTPLISAILMPISSVTVVGFCTVGSELAWRVK